MTYGRHVTKKYKKRERNGKYKLYKLKYFLTKNIKKKTNERRDFLSFACIHHVSNLYMNIKIKIMYLKLSYMKGGTVIVFCVFW